MAHLPAVTSLIIDVSVFVRQCLFNCNVWIPSLQDGLDQTFLKPLSYQNTSFSGRWQFQCKILSCFSRQYLTHAVFVFFHWYSETPPYGHLVTFFWHDQLFENLLVNSQYILRIANFHWKLVVKKEMITTYLTYLQGALNT